MIHLLFCQKLLLNDKNWIEHQYINELKTTTEIAEIVGVSKCTLYRYMKNINVQIPHKQVYEISRRGIENFQKMNNYEWMYNEYINKYRSLSDIAKELHSTREIIKKKLIEFNIPLHTNKYIYYINTDIMDKLNNYDWMKTEYVNHGRSLRSIGRELHVKCTTVKAALIRLNIPIIEHDNTYWMTAERNPQWRGGEHINYCHKFNKTFKEKIRTKFNNRCFECGVLESDKHHHIHHIDYNKNSICNGKEWAFIPLCIKCHNKTHSNRWYWFNKYINYWAYKYWDDQIKKDDF